MNKNNKKRIVIKVGSAVLTHQNRINREKILELVKLISDLTKNHNYEVIFVSSGAVASGYTLLKLDKKFIENRQALASIGQPLLMNIYQKKFNLFDLNVSQILLTQDDFNSENKIQNAKKTINVLLENNIIPVINENDAIAIEELKFGDNDQLSAYATKFFDAELLIILSDIDGYYDKDPRENKNAKIKKIVSFLSQEELNQQVKPNNKFASGGIVTKLKSADFLLKNNKKMFLSSGFNIENTRDFLINNNYKTGTLFVTN
jgi:glutamate 5-kinase